MPTVTLEGKVFTTLTRSNNYPMPFDDATFCSWGSLIVGFLESAKNLNDFLSFFQVPIHLLLRFNNKPSYKKSILITRHVNLWKDLNVHHRNTKYGSLISKDNTFIDLCSGTIQRDVFQFKSFTDCSIIVAITFINTTK